MIHNTLTIIKDEYDTHHVVFRNNHGRIIYLSMAIENDICHVLDCFYVDRSHRKHPKKQTADYFPADNLSEVIRRELDKNFSDINICDDVKISKENLIAGMVKTGKKKILLMLSDNDVLKTIFKNKYHRSIYLEVSLDKCRALITKCRYCDARAGEKDITPQGLVTVYYNHSLDSLLKIVNTELEGGFTDIMISSNHTITLDCPICGSI